MYAAQYPGGCETMSARILPRNEAKIEMWESLRGSCAHCWWSKLRCLLKWPCRRDTLMAKVNISRVKTWV